MNWTKKIPNRYFKTIATKLALRLSVNALSNVVKNRVDNEPFNFLSTSSDPQLVLKPRGRLKKTISPGFYLFRFRLKSLEFSKFTAKVYLPCDEGKEELSAVSVTSDSHALVSIFLFIQKPTTSLRFDPCEVAGQFSLSDLMLTKVPASVALPRIKKGLRGLGEKDSTDGIYEKYRAQLSKSTAQGHSYQDWIKQTESQYWAKLASAHIEENIKFSILLPTYNTPADLLRETLESVSQQSYSNWELCICDDASTNRDTIGVLKSFQNQYPKKVKVHLSKVNGHISTSSNQSLNLAEGDFCVLLDHDDLLSQDTLKAFAIQLQSDPRIKLVYADEDKIDEEGYRQSPHFKPDWNEALLLSQNYICHPVALQTARLKEIGGFRTGVEGSQDHDLLLRFVDGLKGDEIFHIPQILYHWRATRGSTAVSSAAKDYTTEAGLNAISDFVAKRDANAKVFRGRFPNTYNISWSIPSPPPLVSLIIPTRDGYEILKQCLESIYEKTDYPNFEVLVIDNQTTCEQTLELFAHYKEHENFKLLRWDHSFNYSAINNFAVQHAKGELIGLVNNDIEVINPEWLSNMVRHAIRPEVGCVGAKLYYPNGAIQHAGVILGIGGVAGHSHKYFAKEEPGYHTRLYLTQEISAVTAACLLVKKSIFLQVGGLNEEELVVAFNDVDFCLKVREAGFRNIFTPTAELYHHESISRGSEDSPEKIARFNKEANYMRERWSSILDCDPAYNPNLTRVHEDFSLRIVND